MNFSAISAHSMDDVVECTKLFDSDENESILIQDRALSPVDVVDEGMFKTSLNEDVFSMNSLRDSLSPGPAPTTAGCSTSASKALEQRPSSVHNPTTIRNGRNWRFDKGVGFDGEFFRAVGWLESPPTYHLEVKATLGDHMEPFFMSYNQQQLARKWTIPHDSTRPEHVYVIIQVFNLRTSPEFREYIDPWSLYLKDELLFKPQGTFTVMPTP
ncbi:MAG: hypothetical protein M1834_006541 [Cirrosporium novae-zelandiae]|nr:MAG: hypothetical protein M1834_006541 [Cirrosporium novae-zelandiae]